MDKPPPTSGAPSTPDVESLRPLQVVTFQVGDNLYALDINTIREIKRLPGVTPLPGQPDFVEGVITLRGEVIPVVDLAVRMAIRKRAEVPEYLEGKRKLIIVFVRERPVGFIVDVVSMPETIRQEEIVPPGELFKQGPGNKLITGLVQRKFPGGTADKLIILLDLQNSLEAHEIPAV